MKAAAGGGDVALTSVRALTKARAIWQYELSDSAGRTHNRLRDALAIAEVAMAFVLVVGAGLMAKTFWRLTSLDAGYDPHNVLTLTTSVVSPKYERTRIVYYREMLARLRSVPGITGVAFSSLIPMDYTDTALVYRDDRPRPSERDAPRADQFSVSNEYFQVMRVPLKLGRVFNEQDTETTLRVALINETCARTLIPNEEPVGKRIKLDEGTGDGPWMTIVGVVGDVRQDGLDHSSDMQVYMALNQKASGGFYRMLARTSGNPMALEQAVRNTFRAVDPQSPVYHVKTLEAYFSARLADRTFALALLAALGTLALVLAVIGVYGVISYSVAQRIREIGIRMALGAGRSEILTMLLHHALVLIGTGLAFGFGASIILEPLLIDLLFGVAPNDSTISLAVALILGSVAMAAAVIPAIRAASADPAAALRAA